MSYWDLGFGHWELTWLPSQRPRLDAVAAGPDNRLDELTIRVLVSTIDQLGEGVLAIGGLVVDAGEVEGSQRIVRRPDDEQSGEAAAEVFEDVAKAGGFER